MYNDRSFEDALLQDQYLYSMATAVLGQPDEACDALRRLTGIDPLDSDDPRIQLDTVELDSFKLMLLLLESLSPAEIMRYLHRAGAVFSDGDSTRYVLDRRIDSEQPYYLRKE